MPTTLDTPQRALGADETSTGRPITGRFVLIALIAFFSVVFSMNILLAKLAVSTFGGVETESSYRAGLDFARARRAVEKQDALGWRVDIVVTRDTTGAARIGVAARDKDGRAIEGVTARAILMRPINRRHDREVSLAAAGEGQFEGLAADIDPGQWDVRLELRRNAGGDPVFTSRNRIVLDH
jgi:nitrogen fixation protein FixH